jgi:hypothetical protein
MGLRYQNVIVSLSSFTCSASAAICGQLSKTAAPSDTADEVNTSASSYSSSYVQADYIKNQMTVGVVQPHNYGTNPLHTHIAYHNLGSLGLLMTKML